MAAQNGLIFALACAIFALIYGGWSAKWILAQPAGNERMREIAAAIQTGAKAYLNRQYKTVAVVAVIVAVLIGASNQRLLVAAVVVAAVGFVTAIVGLALGPRRVT